jgi:hypothetical protein
MRELLASLSLLFFFDLIIKGIPGKNVGVYGTTLVFGTFGLGVLSYFFISQM